MNWHCFCLGKKKCCDLSDHDCTLHFVFVFLAAFVILCIYCKCTLITLFLDKHRLQCIGQWQTAESQSDYILFVVMERMLHELVICNIKDHVVIIQLKRGATVLETIQQRAKQQKKTNKDKEAMVLEGGEGRILGKRSIGNPTYSCTVCL